MNENKQKILDLLTAALQQTNQYEDLKSLTLVKEGNEEYVQAIFESGTAKANVSLDSGAAMIRDVLRQI